MTTSVAVLMLLPTCNMTCSFCITENSMGTFSWSQATALLQKLSNEGVRTLVFGGGEPLLWKGDVFKLAALAKDQGFLVQVGTNGILLKPGFENLPMIDRYVLPLDGSRPEIHNAVRMWGNQHHQIITERLERLRAAQKTVTISTVVTKKNSHDLVSIGNYLKSLNDQSPFIHAWHLYQFVPEGRDGSLNVDNLLLSMEDYKAVTSLVRAGKLGFTIFNRPDMMRSKTVGFFWMQDNKLWRKLGSEEFQMELAVEEGPSTFLS